MDLSSPFESMFPTVDSAVLTVLTGSIKPRTGREVARLANRSQAATQRVLDRLVEHGLVLKEEAGRARVYTFNWDHLAADALGDLTDLRLVLFRRLEHAIGTWPIKPVHVSVFGSAARGDGGLDSDIDIFLVRPENEEDELWRAQVESIANGVFEWTGNHAGIAEVSEDDLERLRHDHPPIVDSLRADAVHIAGIPIQELLRGI